MALGTETAILRFLKVISQLPSESGTNVTSRISRPIGRVPGCLASQAFVKWKMLPKIIAVQEG